MKKTIISLLAAFFMIGYAYGQLNTDRVLMIGQNALYFEDYVLAIQYFNQVINAKPYLPEPYYYRAIAKIQLEDYAGAEADCTAALDRNPFIPGAYYARGFTRAKLKNLTGAEEDINKALEYNPENTDLFRIRIWIYEMEKKYDQALADIDYVTKKSKEDHQWEMDRGQIYIEKGDTIQALAWFDRAIAADSANSAPWSARGTIRLQMHQNDEALHDLDRAIALKSQYVGDYINRGLLNYWNKNYRGAFADYDRAIELDKNNVTAHYNRGVLRSEVGDLNNAILDFDAVLAIEPNNYSAIYQRGLLNMEVGALNQAIADFTAIINRYPLFSPAYWGRAKAKQSKRDTKSATQDLAMAQELEKKKPKMPAGVADTSEVDTHAKMAANTNTSQSKASIFNDLLAKGVSTASTDDQTQSKGNLRGPIQNINSAITNEPNFVLSYYSKENELKRLSYYFSAIDDYNKKNKLTAKLKMTNDEVTLTNDMVNLHFATIDELTAKIRNNPKDADAYFIRGINYAMVLDYTAAVDDMTRAVELRSDFSMAYFCRANIRYKMLDYKINNPDTKSNATKALSFADLYKMDVDAIIKDYKKTIELSPDFAFAKFNLGNLYCQQKDFQNAIDCYGSAIKNLPDFAEAYFNRGLAYLYINDAKNGNADLSRSGELGIYKAYNIMKRLNEN